MDDGQGMARNVRAENRSGYAEPIALDGPHKMVTGRMGSSVLDGLELERPTLGPAPLGRTAHTLYARDGGAMKYGSIMQNTGRIVIVAVMVAVLGIVGWIETLGY